MSKLPFPGLGRTMGEHTPLRAFLRRLPMYLILTAFALMYLEPVLYMMTTAFKSARDLTDATAKWIPREPTMTSMNFAFDAMKVWPTFLPDRSLWENLMRSNLFVSIVTTFVPALVQVSELVQGLADMLALAINSALQPNYTIEELSHYLH